MMMHLDRYQPRPASKWNGASIPIAPTLHPIKTGGTATGSRNRIMTFENFHAGFYGLWRQGDSETWPEIDAHMRWFPRKSNPHPPPIIRLPNLLVNLIECVDG